MASFGLVMGTGQNDILQPTSKTVKKVLLNKAAWTKNKKSTMIRKLFLDRKHQLYKTDLFSNID